MIKNQINNKNQIQNHKSQRLMDCMEFLEL